MSVNSNVGRVFNLTSGSGDMAASVYDPTGKSKDVFAYADRVAKAVADKIYNDLTTDGAMYQVLSDSAENTIQDSSGNDISGRILFEIK